MPTPTKVATKTKWALDDIEEAAIEAKDLVLKIEAALSKTGNTQHLTHVLALVLRITEIERIALLARRGEYEERKGQRWIVEQES